jgi:hypothetical protein
VTPAQACRDAGNLIVSRGLARGTLEDREGRLCLSGALHVAFCGGTWLHHPDHLACYSPDDWDQVMSAIRKVLERRRYPRFFTRWNDAPGRTPEEAKHLLDEAADWLEEKDGYTGRSLAGC